MEIYCSKSPAASPIKRAPRNRPRPSVLTNDVFDTASFGSSGSVVGVTTSNGTSSAGKAPGQLGSGHSYQYDASQPVNNSHFGSAMASPRTTTLVKQTSGYLLYRENGFDDEFDLGSKMSAINEEILTAKLKRIAVEQQKHLTNGSTHSASSSALSSRTSSFFDRSVNLESSEHVEHFYINEGSGSVSPYTNESIDDDDARSSCNSVISHIRTNVDSDEAQIRSPKGTVRGNRNRVRASVAAFQAVEEAETPGATVKPNYADRERGKIVFYSTTLSVIRETFERCQRVRQVLLTHMVRYEERDLFMNKEMQTELRERLDLETITVPWVFVHGRLLGDATRIHEMNESGDLRMHLRQFPKVTLRVVCDGCGGYRYVPCPICHGSKKSLLHNHSLQEFRALKCTNCNENGLVQCEKCLGVED